MGAVGAVGAGLAPIILLLLPFLLLVRDATLTPACDFAWFAAAFFAEELAAPAAPAAFALLLLPLSSRAIVPRFHTMSSP